MSSIRVAGVAALSALLVLAGGSALAAPASYGSGSAAGGTTVSGTVIGGVTFTQVSTTGFHSVALGSDGNAYAWGLNGSGRLGDGSTADSSVPVLVLSGAVPDGVLFTQVSAGGAHSLAMGSDGNTYAWGDNSFGQLGNNSTTRSSVPVLVSVGAVPGGVTFTQVLAGGDHSLALGSDGKAYAWGGNGDGQLGNNSITPSSVPVPVSAGHVPDGVTFAELSPSDFHSLALGSDGNAYAWGDNSFGQLGNNSTTDSLIPVLVSAGDVPDGVTLTSISAGFLHSLALGSDGNVYAWGNNSLGPLGNNSTTDSSVPVRVWAGDVPDGVTLTTVSAGSHYSLAAGSDGNTYAWGSNSYGELGNNSATPAPAPMPVRVAAGAVPDGVTLLSVRAGCCHSLALGSDGNAYTWGYNGGGRLGNNSTTASSAPVEVERSVVITGVSFGGVDGTGLTQSAGIWSITTPAHESGSVDVVVSHTQFGVSSSQTRVAGFTYLELLAATGSPVPFLAVGSALSLLLVGGGFLLLRRTVAQRLTA
jgi:alpha-tubulin suppressor-like RCC1 family protein